MENNIDLELSFNDWDLSKQKTLKEPKRAYFSASDSSIRSFCQVKLGDYKGELCILQENLH